MNFELQNAIAAFVDSLRGTADIQREIYLNSVGSFATFVSNYLTSIGFPPR
ncbi:MAG: hypothetical protein WBF79_05340 [Rhodococcus sp. (in: high G+C Gram-positive bacteria)]